MSQANAPIKDRPEMPEGYGVPDGLEGTYSWGDVQEPLRESILYWVCTSRPDGRPHAVPLWGAWTGDTFLFEGGADTVRGKNIAHNPAIAVHIERGTLAIMLEGNVEVGVELAAEQFQAVAADFERKYNYRPTTTGGWYALRPHKVMAWDEFPRTPTRFRFTRPTS